MTEAITKFGFHGLWYDALSGELHPPQDPQRRIHTLGRLAYAAVTNGNVQVDPKVRGGVKRVSVYHSPSWADYINMDVFADMAGDIALVDTLYLSDGADNELAIFLRNESTIVVNDRAYTLEPDERLLNARAAITEAAQEFFNHTQRT
jgi:hypothetical protein